MKGRKNNRKLLGSLGAVIIALVIVCTMIISLFSSVSAQTLTADGDTTRAYMKTTEDNTQNIGRVWTDKSVFTDEAQFSDKDGNPTATIEKDPNADFLVSLSALSSVANFKGQTTVPLDIVLVLDVSGSMETILDESYNYTSVSNLTYSTAYNNRNRTTYCIKVEDNYYEISVTRDGNRGNYSYSATYEKDGEDVSLESNVLGNTNFTENIYVKTEATRLDALKTSVYSFIDETAKMNEGITDESKQHQIAIVKFSGDESDTIGNDTYTSDGYTYNYSQIVSSLNVCTSDNSSALKSTVNNLTSNGATRADNGMRRAIAALNASNRSDSKKVVVFFTDGQPTSGSTFNKDVANAAIANAKTLKDNGTLIYSIGVFDDADPDDTTTSEFNRYMHGVSSNYPSATEYTNLGTRVKDSQYYKAASNASELNNIFNEIANEISEQAESSPIEVSTGNNANADGYLTFTDQLGSYMEVTDDFGQILFANNVTQLSSKEITTDTDDITVTKYIFEYQNAGNVLYPTRNLHDIIIEVTRYKNDKDKGDIVTVRIPVGLIPMRRYNVNIDANGKATTQIDEAYPIRVLYNVKLKDGIEDDLKNPDDKLKAYINANSDEDGNVKFYSNDFDRSTKEAKTTASFIPSATNEFYYFQSDQPIYSNENCTTQVTEINDNTEYYYKRAYYSEGEGTQNDYVVPISATNVKTLRDIAIKGDDGYYYIPAHTARLTSLYQRFHLEKESNTTGTASYVTNPVWSADNQDFTIYLGNNGVKEMEVPGTLSVSKTVEVTPGHDTPDANTEFNFELSLTAPSGSELAEQYTAQKFTNGVADGEPVTLNVNDGKTTFTLKDKQTISIYGLEAGVGYTVKETDLPTGFTSDLDANGSSGTIESNDTSTVAVKNAYEALPTTLEGDATNGIKAQKVYQTKQGLSAWDITPTAKFDFVLARDTTNAPMPADSSGAQKDVSVSNGNVFNFGAIEYTQPGEYVYNVYERTPIDESAIIPGVSYSNANYQVTVKVEDQIGQLQITDVSMVQTNADFAGGTISPVTNNTAVITNTFDAESQYGHILATKILKDKLTDDPLSVGNDTFSFKLDAITENAPMPKDENGIKDIEYNSGSTIAFDILFTVENVNSNGYIYKISEVNPGGPDSGKYQGIIYDDTVFYAKLIASVNADDIVEVETKYYSDENCTNEIVLNTAENERITFTNYYEAEPYTLTDNSVIHGTKTITGRDMQENENYSFSLKADAETLLKQQSGYFEIAQGGTEAIVAGAKAREAVPFNFGNITFYHEGEYNFEIKENAPLVDGNGMRYDRHTGKVKVIVTDTDGVLSATVEYSTGDESLDFVNEYTSSTTYANGNGILLSKVLNGRNMTANQFTFTITPIGDAPTISATDSQFTNATSRDGVAWTINKLTGLSFTQTNAGKTYSYIIDEVEAIDDNSSKDGIQNKGVTYDQTQYRLDITVNDNYDGTMYTITTVTKVKSTDGKDVEEKLASYDSRNDEIASLEFVNAYTADEYSLNGSTYLNVSKRLVGRTNNEWLETDNFEFLLEGYDQDTKNAINAGDVVLDNTSNDVLDSISINIGKPESGNTNTKSFNNIIFNKAGTYSFVIQEKLDGITENNGKYIKDGIEYDSSKKIIAVNVRDNGEGQLVSSGATGDLLFFANTYSVDKTSLDGSVNLQVTKTFTGRQNAQWLNSDSFEFKLEAAADDEVTQDAVEAGDITLPGNLVINNDNKEKAAFGNITFKTEGTYKFNVSEIIPEDTKGITYDDSIKTITVNVVDNHDGTMTASLDESSEALEFENTYSVDETSLNGSTNLQVTKTFIGRQNDQWLDSDSFEFKLEAADKETQNAVETDGITLPSNLVINNDNKEKAAFGNITFKTEGTYKFNVSEVIPEDTKGITYDDSIKTITVNVVDNHDGTMTASLDESSEALEFNNIYGVNEVPLSGSEYLKVTKVLSGRNWNESDEFKFILEATGDTLTAVENGNVVLPDNASNLTISGKDKVKEAAFGNIIFKKAGDYEFVIKETNTNVERISYDSHKVVVKVQVTDNNNGQLVAASPSYEGNLTFTNEYTPSPVTLAGDTLIHGTKTISGRDFKTNEKFDFTITAVTESAPMPKDTTVSSGTNGSITFPAITYEKAGTYVYKVQEKNAGETIDGLKYDNSAVTVTVEVSYSNDTGILTPTVSYTKDGKSIDALQFVNEYEAKSVDLKEADLSLGFTAKKVVNASEGNKFNLVGGEFEFMITPAKTNPTSDPLKETTVTNDDEGTVKFANALTYTESGTYEYTISEVNNSIAGMSYDSKTYTVTVQVTDNQNGQLEASVTKNVDGVMTFTNSYDPASTNALIKAKKTLSGKDLEANQFSFELKDEATGTVIDTAKNDASGVVSFEAIEYTKPGDYVYTIREVNDGKEGYTYDSQSYKVTVNVKDDNGALKATVTGNNPTFNNTYKAKSVTIGGNTNIKLHANKVLNGRSLNANEFEFELIDQLSGKVVATATNDTEGNLYFGEITYDEEGTYYYTVSEKNNGLGGIAYDLNNYTLKVIVTDEGGHLGAKASFISDGQELEDKDVVFTNTYQAASTSIRLGATKKLDGRALKAGEFNFELKDADGKVLSNVTNDENGVIQFDSINFDKVGTYKYTVSEVKGDDENITYDTSKYLVTVEVTDNLAGNLETAIDITKDGQGADGLVFINVYENKEIPVVTKTGDNSPIMEMMMAFIVSDILLIACLLKKRKVILNK